jgi:hypothetical protein
MNLLHEFQAAAHDRGFVDVLGDEYGEDSVLWLRKATQDANTSTHQRLCIDSTLKSATVYWMGVLGKIDSKTFRTAAGLQEWFASQPAS